LTSVARNRALTIAAFLVTVVVAFALTRGDDYAVTVRLADAGQLVDGNEIRIGGATVGTVADVRLGRDGAAEVELAITDDDVAPLRRGTLALVRNSSVSSVAGRYVALELGPSDAPPIDDGGTIDTEDTRAAVDFDQFLNAVDIESRRALKGLFRDGAAAFTGTESAFGRTLEKLNPALSQVRALTAQIAKDEPALRRLLVSTATVASAFAESREDLQQGIVSAAATVRSVSERRDDLRTAIAGAPRLLGQARTTLADADLLLRDARPVLRSARPVSPRLATTLRAARPAVAELKPLLRTLRGTLPALDDALDRLPALERRSVPALQETTRAVEGLLPTVRDLLPYTPDLVHGLLASFGGRAATQYDAVGHYSRIAPIINADSLPALLGPLTSALDPLLQQITGFGLSTPSKGNLIRCPGGATLPSADGSRPGRPAIAPTDCTTIRETP